MYGGPARRSGRSSPDLDSQYESTNRNRLTGRDVLGYGELPSLAMILTTLASYATRIARFTIGATLSDKLYDPPEDFGPKDKDFDLYRNYENFEFHASSVSLEPTGTGIFPSLHFKTTLLDVLNCTQVLDIY